MLKKIHLYIPLEIQVSLLLIVDYQPFESTCSFEIFRFVKRSMFLIRRIN